VRSLHESGTVDTNLLSQTSLPLFHFDYDNTKLECSNHISKSLATVTVLIQLFTPPSPLQHLLNLLGIEIGTVHGEGDDTASEIANELH
jgi:hypothetical protein